MGNILSSYVRRMIVSTWPSSQGFSSSGKSFERCFRKLLPGFRPRCSGLQLYSQEGLQNSSAGGPAGMERRVTLQTPMPSVQYRTLASRKPSAGSPTGKREAGRGKQEAGSESGTRVRPSQVTVNRITGRYSTVLYSVQ